MKQKNGKKSNKWLLPVLILVALAAVIGIVLAIVLPGNGEQPGSQASSDGRPVLYWNYEGESYIEAETGMSTRGKQEDGMYHISLLVDGEEKDMRCADKQLINYMDTMKVLMLTLDENGDIINAVNAEEAVTKIADGFYVQKVDGSTATFNTSFAMNGMELPLELGELCKIYNMDPSTDPLGKIDSLGIMDQVSIYGLDETTPTHIFIVEWGYGVLSKGTTLCLNMYGSNIKHATRIFVAGGSKLNLMGKGTITATGIHKNDSLKTDNLTVTDGEINVYSGVTVKSANKNIPAIFVNGKNAVVNLHGGKIVGGATISQGLLNLDGKINVKGIYIGAKGRLNVKETWTGEATMQAAVFTLEGISKTYGTSEGAFTGELTYECQGDPRVIGQDGGLFVLGGSTVNLMGKGTLTTNGTSTSAGALTGGVTVNDGVVNVMGQIRLGSLNAEVPAAAVQYAAAAINLKEGSVIEGGVLVNKGNLVLSGSAKATDIQVSADGNLTVKADFTGSAVATFAAALEENLVPAANGASEGAFTGILTVGDVKLIGKDGA